MTEQTINVTIGEDTINVTLEAGMATPVYYVAEDQEFKFDGQAGNTYIKYNSTTQKLELWVDGIKKQQW